MAEIFGMKNHRSMIEEAGEPADTVSSGAPENCTDASQRANPRGAASQASGLGRERKKERGAAK